MWIYAVARYEMPSCIYENICGRRDETAYESVYVEKHLHVRARICRPVEFVKREFILLPRRLSAFCSDPRPHSLTTLTSAFC